MKESITVYMKGTSELTVNPPAGGLIQKSVFMRTEKQKASLACSDVAF